MRTRGFVTNEWLIGIAVTMVWVGLSLPLYARIVKQLSRGAAPVGAASHLAALAVAALAPVAVVALLYAVAWLGEWVWRCVRRRGRPE
ncbi:MAG: hypothetical protein ACO1SX_22950 [Actinomycetota bacterium]